MHLVSYRRQMSNFRKPHWILKSFYNLGKGHMRSITTWLPAFKVSAIRFSNQYRIKPLPIGDFTKGLVENPPKTLWTRELKVSQLLPWSLKLWRCSHPRFLRSCFSSLGYRIPPHCTSGVSESVLEQALAPHYQPASSLHTGMFLRRNLYLFESSKLRFYSFF